MRVALVLNVVENLLACPGNDTLHLVLATLDGVGFAGARLPIGDDGAVVALEHGEDDGLHGRGVQLLLQAEVAQSGVVWCGAVWYGNAW